LRSELPDSEIARPEHDGNGNGAPKVISVEVQLGDCSGAGLVGSEFVEPQDEYRARRRSGGSLDLRDYSGGGVWNGQLCNRKVGEIATHCPDEPVPQSGMVGHRECDTKPVTSLDHPFESGELDEVVRILDLVVSCRGFAAAALPPTRRFG
jgi:hypothetical protein